MPFPLEETDRLLSTTRSVRRRLDLERPVPEELILDCIDLAEQAPTGGNQPSRRWLVIRDPRVKAKLADLYREAGGSWLSERASALAGSGDPRERAARSGGHLADHLHEVPALVLVTIYGEHDGSGRPGLFDSVIQAAWSFCLAARARGLGTAWTTLHLGEADAVAELLEIPEGVTQVVLLPVAFSIGDDFSIVDRRPAREITWFDKWGRTLRNTVDGRSPVFADGAGVTVEVDIDAKAADIWPIVSDINLPARFSDEFQGADWIDDEPAVGARFSGRNQRDDLGEWEVICTLVDYEPERVFAWHAGDPDNPAAQWRFEIEPLLGGTRLRFSMVLGPGPSGLTGVIEAMPDKESAIIANRQKGQAANMRRTIEGIRDLAEAATA
jgi:nitroreductase